ncbi:hypothetical protein B0T16DRAFT_155902 [Cercophora newfieldiana]|uniref:Proteophosphoglycan 5 n=1 Tax=Cercophora newfieldiana TaxID=92897 RepID=A0AA39Y6C1_9PEZI|nr:hypothetical protein B0T16DRAFT_155902 [Cercophora newfieldiana]
MQQQSNPHRGTPGRRRGNRHSVNSPARRTYASESDMPMDVPFPIDFNAGSPYTPQKLAANNSPAPGSQPNNIRSRQRSGNKPRQKQGSTSPAPTKPGRTTPPQSTAASKSAAAAAFAGATFHASPAPSSLPIPSFLAKALDSPGLKDTGRVSQEPSPPPTDSEAPTPKRRPLVSDIAREESPLDLFFRADRAEKERARRASSANILATNPGPFSPPVQPSSPQEPRTLPNGIGAYRRKPTSQRNPPTGISPNELDGTPGRPMGPAFSTPYQDRIRAAARSSERQAEPSPPPKTAVQQANDALGERLKKFLAVPSSSEQVAEQTIMAPAPVPSSTLSGAGWTGPSVQHDPMSSSPSAGPNGSRSLQLLHMEDSLRRMLKISPGPDQGAAPPTNYQSS